MITTTPLIGFAAAAAIALSGCTTLQVVQDRLEERAQDLAVEYCGLSAPTRLITRGAVNNALAGNAGIVVVCAADPEFSEFSAKYIAPYEAGSLQAAVIEAMMNSGKNEITLPDGTVLSLVVSNPRSS